MSRSSTSRLPVLWLLLSLTLICAFVGGQLLRPLLSRSSAPQDIVAQALVSSTGTGQVVRASAGRSVSLTQAICGYKLTIKKVYADPQQAIVAYTVGLPTSGPALAMAAAIQPTTLPTLSAAPDTRFSFAALGVSPIRNHLQGQVLTFAVQTMATPSQHELLKLVIPAGWLVGHYRTGTQSRTCASSAGGGVPGAGASSNAAFNFVLGVSLAPMLVLNPNTEARNQHARVQLQRVEITPINTRLYFRVQGAAAGLPAEMAVPAQLRAVSDQAFLVSHDGKLWYPGKNATMRRPGLWSYDFAAPFYAYRGIAIAQLYTEEQQDDSMDGDADYRNPLAFRINLRSGGSQG